MFSGTAGSCSETCILAVGGRCLLSSPPLFSATCRNNTHNTHFVFFHYSFDRFMDDGTIFVQALVCGFFTGIACNAETGGIAAACRPCRLPFHSSGETRR
jgi:hypothetical protein